MKPFRVLLLFVTLSALAAGCSAIEKIAPAPPATLVPTDTAVPSTPTPEPTFGPLEYIDAAYCWESHIDTGEFNLERFFPDGTVIDVFVQPYDNCQEAWDMTKEYLTVDSTNVFNHGEYMLSGEHIRFTLCKPGSDDVVGEVNGTYHGNTMLLLRQGAEEWEYVQVYGGNP
jgi:hypothetical protein